MKRKDFIRLTILTTVSLAGTKTVFGKSRNKIYLRVAAYNVLFGNWGTPKRIGEMFKPYDLDVICFSEVPDGDWTAKVGKELNMNYSYVGKISSANHKDKFKSILSRTPLFNQHEIEINANGWKPASIVGAETNIKNTNILIYSVHIPGTNDATGSASEFIANQIIPKIKNDRFIIMGDFNNHIGDAPLNLIENKGMRNVWNDLNIDVQQISTHKNIERGIESGVIDHIYYNSKILPQVYDGGIIINDKNPKEEEKTMQRGRSEWKKYGKPLSDHRPIWAAIKW